MADIIATWDAYDFRNQFIDDFEWSSSFLFYNELQTLKEKIKKSMLRGKLTNFYCELEGGDTGNITCTTVEDLFCSNLFDLKTTFTIRQYSSGSFKIDTLDLNDRESTFFLTRV